MILPYLFFIQFCLKEIKRGIKNVFKTALCHAPGIGILSAIVKVIGKGTQATANRMAGHLPVRSRTLLAKTSIELQQHDSQVQHHNSLALWSRNSRRHIHILHTYYCIASVKAVKVCMCAWLSALFTSASTQHAQWFLLERLPKISKRFQMQATPATLHTRYIIIALKENTDGL